MRILARKANKNGVEYALSQDGDLFSVWKLCSNYDRHAPDGIRRVWRYIERGLDRPAADALYARRSK